MRAAIRRTRIFTATLSAVAAVALLGLAGCDGDEETVDTGTTAPGETTTTLDDTTTSGDDVGTTTTGADGLALTESCENSRDGYRLSYPADWYTNAGEIEPPCRFFAASPVEVEEGTEPDEPVIADVEPVEFDRATEPDRTQDIISERSATIAGEAAVRLEYEATGESLYGEGTLVTTWYVDLGDEETFIATAMGAGSVSYEDAQRTLDAMIETLELVAAEA